MNVYYENSITTEMPMENLTIDSTNKLTWRAFQTKYNWNQKRIELCNISCNGAEVKGFIEVKRKSSEEILSIRPTVHVFYVMPFGLLKTTFADRIKKYSTARANHPFSKSSNLTAPAIAGAIDDKGHFIPPANLVTIGGTFVIDEFRTNPNDKSGAIGAALDVLESEESSRNIGRGLGPKELKKNKYANGVQWEVDACMHVHISQLA